MPFVLWRPEVRMVRDDATDVVEILHPSNGVVHHLLARTGSIDSRDSRLAELSLAFISRSRIRLWVQHHLACAIRVIEFPIAVLAFGDFHSFHRSFVDGRHRLCFACELRSHRLTSIPTCDVTTDGTFFAASVNVL